MTIFKRKLEYIRTNRFSKIDKTACQHIHLHVGIVCRNLGVIFLNNLQQSLGDLKNNRMLTVGCILKFSEMFC